MDRAKLSWARNAAGGVDEGLLGGCQRGNPPDHASEDVAGNASASQATASARQQGHSQC